MSNIIPILGKETDENQENLDRLPSQKRGILSIEHKNLNPENEMKRMFGSKVVNAERNHKKGGRHRAHHARISHWLIAPKPNWPQPGKTGLAMKFLESDKYGNQFFTFEHSGSYQNVQKRFFHAVDSMNPEFIIVS